MNALRTIPKREEKSWVALMFEVGPHDHPNAPDYPLTFPVPFLLREPISGGFLYVVFSGEIIGYGKIGRVEPHPGSTVGETDEPMAAGDNIILDGPLLKMAFHYPYKGFQGIRYTSERLHEQQEKTEDEEALPPVGPLPPVNGTGADLVAYWEQEGVISSRPDITDSQAHARAIRHKAERRERD